MPYHTIYADPPWCEHGGGKICRGANRHYDLMKTSQIIDFGKSLQPLIEDNAHLYLWTTNNFLPDALSVIQAWGFNYKTTITWAKDRIGIGQYYRGQTEHCLFAVRGNLPYKILDNKRQQGSTLIVAPRRKHSQKPAAMRSIIEKVSYPPYLELFAREKTPGWHCYGNEIDSDIKL